MLLTTSIAVGVAVLACITDLHSRRIPNLLTMGAAVSGIVWATATGGGDGLMTSLVGWLLGVILFFPFFALGGLGAGDVKLLGAIGAWLGAPTIAYVGLYSALAGGVLAVLVAARAGYLRQAFRNVWTILMVWKHSGLKPVDGFVLDRSASPRLAYAVPILAGLLVTLWLD